MATPRWITAAEVTQEEAGDVQGPESSVDGNIALFDGTTGKLLKAAGVVEGVATIDATTNILIGDDAGNAVDSGTAIDGLLSLPITLNPGDVLAQTNDFQELISYGDDGARATDYIPHKEDLSGYWSVRSNTPIAGEIDNVSVSENGDITIVCLDGQEPHPAGGSTAFNTGYAFDDGADTPADGGDFNIVLGGGVNGGKGGNFIVSGSGKNVPVTANSLGTFGAIVWDADYIYVCVAPDTWKRVALDTWT